MEEKASDKVSVYQFESVVSSWKVINKDTGLEEVKKISKMERVTKEWTCKEIVEKLAVVRSKYLVHKYQIYNDQYHWPKILDSDDGDIFHIDFSENLSQQYKLEPQSTH